jgi:hypothetical protein
MMRFFHALARGKSPLYCSTEDFSDWLDDKMIAALEKAGLLTREEKSVSISCPACGEHMADLEYRATTQGIRQYIARCDDPSTGAFDISGNHFSYKIVFEDIAHFFAKSLGIKEGVQQNANDLYRLGTVKIHGGDVRCFFLFSDNLPKYKNIFENSSKSASTIVINPFTPPISFIDSVTTLDPTELITINGKTISINQDLFNQAAEKVLGQNSYQNGTLFVRGKPIASFKNGTKEDIILSLISSPDHINKSVSHKDILAYYNTTSPSVVRSGKKGFVAKQWCYQLLTNIRDKCTDETRHLVDIVIRQSGKINQENGLTFVSRG